MRESSKECRVCEVSYLVKRDMRGDGLLPSFSPEIPSPVIPETWANISLACSLSRLFFFAAATLAVIEGKRSLLRTSTGEENSEPGVRGLRRSSFPAPSRSSSGICKGPDLGLDKPLICKKIWHQRRLKPPLSRIIPSQY
jgi:hypothetical protein